jgi:hypothetical protein
MKHIFISTLLACLIGCESTQETKSITNQSSPDSLQEYVVKSTANPQPTETKKIRIKQQSETLTEKVLKGTANVLVDTWMDSEANNRIEKIDNTEDQKSAEKLYDEVDKRY